MTTAIFPGTFDPITKGHLDLITRSTKLFDTVIIAVAKAVHKQTFFTLDKRIELAKNSLLHLPNVQVISFSSLLVECAKEYDANIVIRGIRNGSDFDYEQTMAHMNKLLAKNIETIYLGSDNEYNFISSSLVREISSMGGEISDLVPNCVLKAFN